MNIEQMASDAKTASISMAACGAETKDKALEKIKQILIDSQDEIICANQEDLKNAQKINLTAPLLKRLKFDESKIREVCDGLDQLMDLPDPVGVTQSALELDKDLELYKVSCPIGVIGVVFESRPDALVQISSLCLKSGNAVILKGGSEAAQTNKTLTRLITKASLEAGMPPNWISLLETRSEVEEMLGLDRFIDLIIPRGSNSFVRYIMENTNIPVLGHADGICHVYIDSPSDQDMAIKIAVDSKTQYVAVCNAAETFLIHKDTADTLLPKLSEALVEKGVEIRGCKRTLGFIEAKRATEADWGTEYLDLVVSIKIVDNIDEAIGHINRYGSGHTDVIVSSDQDRGVYFMDHVASADVFLNCSSRFSDGFRYGLGAEVGISTNRIHARGPVGMEGLMIYQWRIIGKGHIVADYSGDNAKKFTHSKLNKSFPGKR